MRFNDTDDRMGPNNALSCPTGCAFMQIDKHTNEFITTACNSETTNDTGPGLILAYGRTLFLENATLVYNNSRKK
jgi:hypothetical protein